MASFALLDALVTDAPVGLGFWGTDLRYRRLNDRLAELAGAPARAHLGRTLPEMLGSLGEQIEACLAEVLRSGEPITDREVSGEPPGLRGRSGHWRFSFYPVDAPNRATLGVGATVVDITAERRMAGPERPEPRDDARAAVLARVSAALSSSLQPEAVFDALVRAVVPELADWCALHTTEADGRMRLVSVAHHDPARQSLAWELARRYPPATAPAGSARRHHDVTNELLAAAADPAHLQSMQRLGVASAVVVPLRARRRVVGALTLVMGESGRRYSGETLELAEGVASQAAVALDNARLYAEQAAVAHKLQRSLLPPALPDIPGMELAARYRPVGRVNEAGGDFYDVFSYDGRRWNFVIGDVVGKGADAAALTALVRYTLHGAATDDDVLGVTIRRVNDALLQRSSSVEFCSAVYGVLTPGRGGADLRLVSCGHPPPLVLRADGSLETVGGSAPLLGIGLTPSLTGFERELSLAAGDTVVLYTDGVIELPGRNPWRGQPLLHATLRAAAGCSAEELVHRVEQATLRASGGAPRDDVAVLALRAAT